MREGTSAGSECVCIVLDGQCQINTNSCNILIYVNFILKVLETHFKYFTYLSIYLTI